MLQKWGKEQADKYFQGESDMIGLEIHKCYSTINGVVYMYFD